MLPVQSTNPSLGQCDQRKPGCLKCETSRKECPGYRDLHQVLFRDESERVRQKAHQRHRGQDSSPAYATTTSISCDDGDLGRAFPIPPSAFGLPVSKVSYGLSQPLVELGLNFFFTRYTFDQPPFSQDYSQWLKWSCSGYTPNNSLRAAIEAVGMAALANVFHAPNAASRSKKQYSKALMATKRALNDPLLALADETMMAIILLGQYEVPSKYTVLP